MVAAPARRDPRTAHVLSACATAKLARPRDHAWRCCSLGVHGGQVGGRTGSFCPADEGCLAVTHAQRSRGKSRPRHLARPRRGRVNSSPSTSTRLARPGSVELREGFSKYIRRAAACLKQIESSEGRVVQRSLFMTLSRAIGRLAISEFELAFPAVTLADDLVVPTPLDRELANGAPPVAVGAQQFTELADVAEEETGTEPMAGISRACRIADQHDLIARETACPGIAVASSTRASHSRASAMNRSSCSHGSPWPARSSTATVARG